MAGIEQLEVHSKSYIVRWLKVDEGQTISWSVQPNKKSINFGIVKHPGTGATAFVANSVGDPAETVTSGVDDSKSSRFGKKDAATAQDQLAAKGFIPIKWHGKCEADKVTLGTYDVPASQAGMFGLVFDNTFSKQTSKTITLVLMTYPTGAPPQTQHNLPNLSVAAGQGGKNGSKTSLGKQGSPNMNAVASESLDSLHSHLPGGQPASISGRSEGGAQYHTGNLLKRRRKKGQGYARRYFSLDYSSCTLSYYYNRNSSALRGAIPLSLAAIAADERRREISIDSGAEIWHLKASSPKDFSDWARALEKASRVARGLDPNETTDQEPAKTPKSPMRSSTGHLRAHAGSNPAEDQEWEQVESLVSRTVGTRDALRRLVRDMAAVPPKSSQSASSQQFLSPSTSSPGLGEDADGNSSIEQPKRPFWKRKSSAPMLTSPGTFQPVVSSSLAVPGPATVSTTISANGTHGSRKSSKGAAHEEKNVQDHCNSLLTDLDTVISEFTALIANSRRRRAGLSHTNSRLSIDTASTDEFFDAEAGDDSSQIVKINGSGEEEEEDDAAVTDADEADIHDSSSVSSTGDDEAAGQGEAGSWPARPKSLAPLPVDISVDRRTTVPPATVQPPSLIGLVRKNVGKDLSAISMPVSTNEPTSMLQRTAEQLEYAQLLNQACEQKTALDRLVYVTAFAVSQFSSGRAKERANRKPFNPMLGETFELLRTEQEVPGGFRCVVEKVTHRPVRIAMQADSANWSLSQAPAPSQKFWGKSAEVITEGRVRLNLRLPDGSEELYSWTHATMFLRNVVMGEKYVEPVGSMNVNNDSTGAKATIDFKVKGVFGGRSEDVQVEILDDNGANTGTGLVGTWTNSLRRTEAGKPVGKDIWKVDKLADNAASAYGLTRFAATLNEITEIERGRLPPTDTRLRPDQRLAEKGDLDAAEEWKVKVEEAQRARRRKLEELGEEYRPKWFYNAGDGAEGDDVWKLKTGRDSYWDEREKGVWKGVPKIFDVE